MLRGSRRFILTALGIALVVGLIGGWAWRDAEQSQRVYERQAEQNAEAYRDSASIHAQRACTLLPSVERRLCVHTEYHEARQREREEYDLQAQLVTSAWTRAMGIAAIIAMGVGILGVGLVYTTFRETQRQVNSFIDAEKPRLIIALSSFSDFEDSVSFAINATNVGSGGCVSFGCFHSWAKREKANEVVLGMPTLMAIPSGETRQLDGIHVKKDNLRDRPILEGYITYEGPFIPEGKPALQRFRFEVFPKMTYPHHAWYIPLTERQNG